jgi:hypothetical protein
MGTILSHLTVTFFRCNRFRQAAEAVRCLPEISFPHPQEQYLAKRFSFCAASIKDSIRPLIVDQSRVARSHSTVSGLSQIWNCCFLSGAFIPGVRIPAVMICSLRSELAGLAHPRHAHTCERNRDRTKSRQPSAWKFCGPVPPGFPGPTAALVLSSFAPFLGGRPADNGGIGHQNDSEVSDQPCHDSRLPVNQSYACFVTGPDPSVRHAHKQTELVPAMNQPIHQHMTGARAFVCHSHDSPFRNFSCWLNGIDF